MDNAPVDNTPDRRSAGAELSSLAGFIFGTALVVSIVSIAVDRLDAAAELYWQAFAFLAGQAPALPGLPTARDIGALLPVPEGFSLPDVPFAVWVSIPVSACLWHLIALVVFRVWALRVPLDRTRGPLRHPFILAPLGRHFRRPGRLAFAIACTVAWPMLAARAFHDRSDAFPAEAPGAAPPEWALPEWALWPGSGRALEGWLEAAIVHAAMGAPALAAIALAGHLARNRGPFHRYHWRMQPAAKMFLAVWLAHLPASILAGALFPNPLHALVVASSLFALAAAAFLGQIATLSAEAGRNRRLNRLDELAREGRGKPAELAFREATIAFLSAVEPGGKQARKPRRPASNAAERGKGRRPAGRTSGRAGRRKTRLRPVAASMAVAIAAPAVPVLYVWFLLPDAEQTRQIARSVHYHVEKTTVPAQGDGGSRIQLRLIGNRYDYSLNYSRENISEDFFNAVIASEDNKFDRSTAYRLPYIAFKFGEATLCYLARTAGLRTRECAGNSTVPQQLARNLLSSEYRSIWRKIVEFVWALKMEFFLENQEILEFYANRVYLGNNTYGAETASRYYFGKHAKDLSLGEAVLLAAAIKKPSRWNYSDDRAGALERARLLLELMKQQGFAPAGATLGAGFRPRRGAVRPNKPYLGHLWMWILPEAKEALRGRPDGKYKVVTALNAEAHIYARVELRREIRRWRGKGIPVGQGAVVVMRPDGRVLAMVGGAGDDQKSRGTNRAKRTENLFPRPPASAFKPFLYLAALERGLRPDRMIDARPVSIPIPGGTRYEPTNHDGTVYRRKVPMRDGLVKSINTAAVHLLRQQVGFDRLIDVLRRLGLKTRYLKRKWGLALGQSGVPLIEMMGAYGVLANGGRRATPYAMLAILRESGDVVWQREDRTPPRIFDPRHVSNLNAMLLDVVRHGTGRPAAQGVLQAVRDRRERNPGEAAECGPPAKVYVAGKTGTGDEFTDAWFMGYTADLVIGVWFGNDNPRTMPELYGAAGPARSFNGILTRLARFTAVTDPTCPLP
ncbi:MAG: hypothetical protein F4204_13930 [Rhodospirillaceae bacterium]|nr:hypothetical protein [Rhodospirillaceae bacterium]